MQPPFAAAPGHGRLVVVPLLLGFLLYFVAGAHGLVVRGESAGFYLVHALVLLVPVVVSGLPLALLARRSLGRLPWLFVLAVAGAVLALALSAGPSVEAVLYLYVMGVATCMVWRPRLVAALMPQRAE